jgi:hypothetical protein
MKKIFFISLFLIALFIAVLPIVGNSYMQTLIEDKLDILNSHGLELKDVKTSSTYLSTNKHFEFINKSTDSMLNGMLLGVDIEYSNIPFSKDVSLDIYPLDMSQSMSNELKTNDINFYNKIKTLLNSKGLLYHIDYNVLSKDFSSYVKDINENYSLKDGEKLAIKLDKVFFNGNGDLISPNRLTSTIKEMKISAIADDAKFVFSLNDFSSSNDFESLTTSISSVKLASFEFTIKSLKDIIDVKMNNIKMKSSSSEKKEAFELSYKSFINSLTFYSNDLKFSVKNLNSDIIVKELDKHSFEELSNLISKTNSSNSALLDQKIQESLIKLLSKGLVLNIADFSIDILKLHDEKALGGFKSKSIIKIKKDDNLVQKLNISPILLASNIDVKTDVNLSKVLYQRLIQNSPLSSTISKYAKEYGDNIVFVIDFIDSSLVVNGTVIN